MGSPWYLQRIFVWYAAVFCVAILDRIRTGLWLRVSLQIDGLLHFLVGFLDGVLDGGEEVIGVEGFCEQDDGARGKGGLAHALVGVAAEDDDGKVGIVVSDLLLQHQSIHPLHVDICDDTAGLGEEGRCQYGFG